MHKSSHTLAAVAAITGELVGDKTAQIGTRGFRELLEWARALGTERVWALEDCRHVGVLSALLDRAWRARRSRPDAVDGQLTARQPPARQV